MNKIEFLNYLRKKLRLLGKENAEDAVNYYEEIIGEKVRDGMSEESAVLSLGNPKIIASDIASEIVASNKIKNPSRSINVILGALVFSPLLFPMALVAVILYIVVFSLWIAFSIGFGGGAIAFIISGISAVFSPIDIGSKFISLGISLITSAICILLCITAVKLGPKLLDLITVKLVRKIRAKTTNKREE